MLTRLAFTSGTGEPVLLAVIFQGEGHHKKVPANWISGIDVKVEPTKCYVSSSGGITSTILVDILTYLDATGAFERMPGGPTPCLIVDGHQSRLDHTFLTYINAKEHKWFVLLGIPYMIAESFQLLLEILMSCH